MAKKRSRYESDTRSPLDMTSMIDVVFLLLIFFMCATKFKIPEGQLRSWLPRDRGNESTSPVITKGCRITLTVEEGTGRIQCWADEFSVPESSEMGEFEQHRGLPGPDLVALEEHIRLRKETYVGLGDKGLPVVIDFSKETPFKYVVDVLDICTRLEIADLGFAQPEIPLE
ncbi:MAG: ExbD/TolR family protein [Planctomycetota bacterium]